MGLYRKDLVIATGNGAALAPGATSGFLWLPTSVADPGTPTVPEAGVRPVIIADSEIKFHNGTSWVAPNKTPGVRIFNNVTEAVAYSFSPVLQLIYCRGLTSSTDGRGGFWIYDPSDSISAVNTYDTFALTYVPGRILKQQ